MADLHNGGVTFLPCDRGMPNGYGTRGLHNFQLAPGTGRPVCTYCGQLAPMWVGGGQPPLT